VITPYITLHSYQQQKSEPSRMENLYCCYAKDRQLNSLLRWLRAVHNCGYNTHVIQLKDSKTNE